MMVARYGHHTPQQHWRTSYIAVSLSTKALFDIQDANDKKDLKDNVWSSIINQLDYLAAAISQMRC